MRDFVINISQDAKNRNEKFLIVPQWQNIIYGNESSYLTKISDAGFDGVYLDIIDAFEYYEK